MKKTRQLRVLLYLSILALAPIYFGCKATLQSGGAYAPMTTNSVGVAVPLQAPDLPFFEVDSAFAVAHDTADLAFSAERNNRELLWKVSPEIKHTLDKIRPQVDEVDKEYALARTAYLANPTPANLDSLSTIMSRLRALTAAAQAAIPQPTSQPPAVPTR